MKKKIIKTIIPFAFLITIALFISACSNLNNKPFPSNLTNYEINIDFDNTTKTLNAKEKVDYINNNENTLKEICFHLYPNAFRENSKQKVVSLLSETKAYPNGKSYGNIEIKSVILNNEKTDFEITGIDENILKINLKDELYPNERAIIEIDFTTKLPNINHRFGYGNDTINLGNFYPIACVYENGSFMTSPYSSNGDPFYSDIANYEVTITKPENLKIANTGKVVEEKKFDEKTTMKLSAKAVRDFAIVLSEKFQIISEKFEDTEVYYYYFSDKNSAKSLETSLLSLKTFTNLFGKYPYSTLSVVEANFVHGGMEYPNLVYISNEITDYDEYTNVIIHEVAHQWWYGLVGNDEYTYSWLDEGITEFSTALFYEYNEGYNRTYKQIMNYATKNYSLFVSVYGEVFGEVDTSMNRDLSQWKTETEYVYVAYVKGMLLYDTLREVLGDKKLIKCLQLYFQQNQYKIATPENIISAFEKGSKTDIESFFLSWIEGKVIIESLN